MIILSFYNWNLEVSFLILYDVVIFACNLMKPFFTSFQNLGIFPQCILVQIFAGSSNLYTFFELVILNLVESVVYVQCE